MSDPNSVSYQVIGAATEVHRHLGAGLLESAYRACLAYELLDRGIAFQQELALPVNYKGQRVSCGFRVDFVVEGLVVVEAKRRQSHHYISRRFSRI
jgi:GxxExxY protein